MQPLIFTIFGATGDLTFRKLIPALFTLYDKNLLINNFMIIGFARREWSDENFKDHLDKYVDTSRYDEKKWREFLKHIKYLCSDFENQAGYDELAFVIQTLEKENSESLKVFYMSTSPEYFETIAENIKDSALCKLCHENTNARIVIEKPYGTDEENVMKVDELLSSSFLSEHIFRIDHFLGKESVQNILVFRFANSIFERLWNKDNIEYIQIRLDETIGVEDRGGFYDKTGALRDMVQNHLLQLLAVVTMEAPISVNGKDIQEKRLDIIKNIFISEKNHTLSVIKGQYKGYAYEKNVDPNSNTETYISMKLGIDKPIWDGVPIYVRTGKKLKDKIFEVSIKFKDKNLNIYDKITGAQNDILMFRINPHEGIAITMMAKEPGNEVKIQPVSLEFCYRPTFNQPVLDSYVGLIQNIINADQSLFASAEEVNSQWKFISTYKKHIDDLSLYEYDSGTYGPKEGDELLEKDGREWVYNESFACAIK